MHIKVGFGKSWVCMRRNSPFWFGWRVWSLAHSAKQRHSHVDPGATPSPQHSLPSYAPCKGQDGKGRNGSHRTTGRGEKGEKQTPQAKESPSHQTTSGTRMERGMDPTHQYNHTPNTAWTLPGSQSKEVLAEGFQALLSGVHRLDEDDMPSETEEALEEPKEDGKIATKSTPPCTSPCAAFFGGGAGGFSFGGPEFSFSGAVAAPYFGTAAAAVDGGGFTFGGKVAADTPAPVSQSNGVEAVSNVFGSVRASQQRTAASSFYFSFRASTTPLFVFGTAAAAADRGGFSF
jgi:hypothetical protein